MRRSRRPRLLVVGLVALLALAACQPVPYSRTGGPRVFYAGDSVVGDSDAEVAWGFHSAGFPVARAVYPGTSIGWSADRIRDQVWGDGGARAPDVVVVAAGSMNVTGGWDAADAGETRTRLDWAWPEGRCAVWVLPATVRHPGPAGDKRSFTDPEAADLVAGIRRTVEPRGVHIANWAAHAAEHPEWYASDGVHHTPAGKAAYAAFVVDRTRRHCGI